MPRRKRSRSPAAPPAGSTASQLDHPPTSPRRARNALLTRLVVRLHYYARTDNVYLRELACQNPRATTAVLAAALARGLRRDVRIELAGHPRADETIRLALAHDEDPSVRIRLAELRPSTEEIDALLIADPSPAVRNSVAVHTVVEDLLARLAGDESTHVRRSVGGNLLTSTAVLQQLAADPDEAVREAVINTAGYRPGVCYDTFRPADLAARDPLTLRTLAASSAAPQLFTDLAEHWSGNVSELHAAVEDLARATA